MCEFAEIRDVSPLCPLANLVPFKFNLFELCMILLSKYCRMSELVVSMLLISPSLSNLSVHESDSLLKAFISDRILRDNTFEHLLKAMRVESPGSSGLEGKKKGKCETLDKYARVIFLHASPKHQSAIFCGCLESLSVVEFEFLVVFQV